MSLGSIAMSGAASGLPKSAENGVAPFASPSTHTSQPMGAAAWRATSRNGGVVSNMLAPVSAS